jgi:hypothetical protein
VGVVVFLLKYNKNNNGGQHLRVTLGVLASVLSIISFIHSSHGPAFILCVLFIWVFF